jgi:hypothetical protein
MTEYSEAFKANMVKKLLVPGGPTGVGAVDSNGNLPTDVVAMASGCERRGNVAVEALAEGSPSSR